MRRLERTEVKRRCTSQQAERIESALLIAIWEVVNELDADR